MDILCYGSFERILRSRIVPKMTQKNLADILLTSAFIEARNRDKTTSRSAHGLDSATLSKLCSGRRGLPAGLARHFSDPDALEYIKLCFDMDILPLIPESAREALKDDILLLIGEDTGIPPETKSYFSRLASGGGLCDFLAEAFLSAVNRKGQEPAANKKAATLPARNRSFYGRDGHLEKIRERYKTGIHVQGLFGMGGAGKTQIALQYAYLHLKEYKAVCWIGAENEPAMQGSISSFLSSQDCLPEKRTPESLQEAFLDYLDSHNKWLLIYDNAEYGTPEEYQMLESYFPRDASKGDVILTTRCRAPFGEAAQMEVTTFTEEEAVLFLQHRSGLNAGPHAAVLARQLGSLPLALEYAAAYIRETPDVDCLAYSRKLEKAGIRVLDYRVGYHAYKNTVRQAFHITLDKLLEATDTIPASVSAWQFLNICAFLAPEGIEISIFSQYGTGLPEPLKSVLWDELDRDDLLRDLTRYSLVRIEGGVMSMHRLLQEVLRDELSMDDGMLCINYAFGVFYGIFYPIHTAPADELRLSLAPSVPHVQAILLKYIRLCRDAGREVPDRVMAAKEYFSWTSLLLRDIKQVEDKEAKKACKRNIPLLQTALDFYRMMPEPGTVYHAYILMLLAQASEKMGDIKEAELHYTESLEVMDSVIDLLPAGSGLDCGNTLDILYRDEAFQLSSDICAAIGSSPIIYRQPKILWKNYKGLVKLLRKQFKCYPHKADAHLYKETWLYLWIFSSQVADCTQRAFLLNLGAPENWRQERESLLPDGPFGIFIPTAGPHPEVPANTLDGFDILLEDSNGNKPVPIPGRPWTTLAFPERVRTVEDMLDTLINIETTGLDATSKRLLYAAAYKVAERLKRDDIAALYKERLHGLFQLLMSMGIQ